MSDKPTEREREILGSLRPGETKHIDGIFWSRPEVRVQTPPTGPSDIDKTARELAEKLGLRDYVDGSVPESKLDAIKAALLAERQTVPEWRDISTAPRNGRRVLVVIHARGGSARDCFVRMAYHSIDNWYFEDSGHSIEKYGYQLTHWMPSPAPPKE